MDESDLRNRGFGSTSLLNRLRGLRVVVCCPDNPEREELILNLQRFGFKMETCWPPLESITEDIDLVFLAIVPRGVIPAWALERDSRRAALIAIIGYENPTIMNSVLRISAEGVVASPIRQFGLLATIVLSLQIFEHHQSMMKQVRRLELKLIGIKQVHEAKLIIMNARNVSEEQSYKILREEAMARRMTVESLARTIVEANKIFLHL
ncbi:MAG TPA: ANTAR domain-containing protein [Bellilinea sp.]|nr:ANTAR domain-containing protein [Bellilinea sp.]